MRRSRFLILCIPAAIIATACSGKTTVVEPAPAVVQPPAAQPAPATTVNVQNH